MMCLLCSRICKASFCRVVVTSHTAIITSSRLELPSPVLLVQTLPALLLHILSWQFHFTAIGFFGSIKAKAYRHCTAHTINCSAYTAVVHPAENHSLHRGVSRDLESIFEQAWLATGLSLDTPGGGPQRGAQAPQLSHRHSQSISASPTIAYSPRSQSHAQLSPSAASNMMRRKPFGDRAMPDALADGMSHAHDTGMSHRQTSMIMAQVGPC